MAGELPYCAEVCPFFREQIVPIEAGVRFRAPQGRFCPAAAAAFVTKTVRTLTDADSRLNTIYNLWREQKENFGSCQQDNQPYHPLFIAFDGLHGLIDGRVQDARTCAAVLASSDGTAETTLSAVSTVSIQEIREELAALRP